VAEQAKPRKVTVSAGANGGHAIVATSTEASA
jgi:hypothetical protein